jgi:serine/threonine protein kinase
MAMEPDDLDLEKTLRADGQIILGGRYRIVRELGRGGMGVVYLAEDTHLENRKVAIKMLPAVLARNKRAIRDLKKEALVAMELVHPQIVQLRAFEQKEEGAFLVMDYIDGETLEDILAEQGPLGRADIARMFIPIAQAIDYAHSKGIVHRDIKPSNIIISKKWTPYITDFGIARVMKDSYTCVTGQETSGTLPYMSPQQLMGDSPIPSMDIYSFGAVLYECLSGHPPFFRGDIREQIKNKQPDELDNVPDHINTVLKKTLSKDSVDRPASAVECMLLFEDKTSKQVLIERSVSVMASDQISTIEVPENTLKAEHVPAEAARTVDTVHTDRALSRRMPAAFTVPFFLIPFAYAFMSRLFSNRLSAVVAIVILAFLFVMSLIGPGRYKSPLGIVLWPLVSFAGIIAYRAWSYHLSINLPWALGEMRFFGMFYLGIVIVTLAVAFGSGNTKGVQR